MKKYLFKKSIMKKEKIKVVCFDLWNTLVYKVNGPPISHICHYLNMDLKDFAPIAEKSLMLKEEPLRMGMERLVKKLGLSNVYVRKLENIWMKSDQNIQFFPETQEVLCGLKSEYKLVLITNTVSSSWNAVENKFHLSKFFDYCYLSFKEGHIKPGKTVFKKILQVFSITPDEVLMMGDSPRSDLIIPQKMGMRVILIDRDNHLNDQGYNKTKSLKEIFKFLNDAT